jgi:hypothetical protein
MLFVFIPNLGRPKLSLKFWNKSPSWAWWIWKLINNFTSITERPLLKAKPLTWTDSQAWAKAAKPSTDSQTHSKTNGSKPEKKLVWSPWLGYAGCTQAVILSCFSILSFSFKFSILIYSSVLFTWLDLQIGFSLQVHTFQNYFQNSNFNKFNWHSFSFTFLCLLSFAFCVHFPSLSLSFIFCYLCFHCLSPSSFIHFNTPVFALLSICIHFLLTFTHLLHSLFSLTQKRVLSHWSPFSFMLYHFCNFLSEVHQWTNFGEVVFKTSHSNTSDPGCHHQNLVNISEKHEIN